MFNRILKSLIIGSLLLFTCPAWAVTRYVSPSGTAAWGDCTSVTTPEDTTANCSIATANTHAAAGDTVYLRKGTYTISSANGYFINPSNSGTDATHRIEFANYNNEDVTIQSSAANTFVIHLVSKNWIYVHGSSGHLLNLLTNDTHLYLTTGSSHNEIAYIYTNGSYTTPSISTGSGAIIQNASNYNWIHNCIFTDHGGQSTAKNGYFDGHYPFLIGGEGGVASNIAAYNLIENNEFKNGGHAAATDNGSYNIFRNNFMHNELYLSIADNQFQVGFINGSTQIYGDADYPTHNPTVVIGKGVSCAKGVGSGLYGTAATVTVTSGSWGAGTAAGTITVHYVSDGGNSFTDGEVLCVHNTSTQLAVVSGATTQIADYGNTYVGYHVFQTYCNCNTPGNPTLCGGNGLYENNIMGYGAENLNPTNYAGVGFKVTTPYNIIRRNDLIGNWLAGMGLIDYGGIAAKFPHDNHIYNNTTLGNGVHPATYNGSVNMPSQEHSMSIAGEDVNIANNFGLTGNNASVVNNVVVNNLLAENKSSTCQGTNKSGIWDVGTNNIPTGQIIGKNWDTCSDHWATGSYQSDPAFTSSTMPLYNAMNLTSASNPTLTLTLTSPAKDQGVYLTTATVSDTNTLAFADASYFFDATPFSGLPTGANVNSDWVCFTTSSTTVDYNHCMQIGSISGNNVTINSHGLTPATTYYVWHYKTSDGTQILYGYAPDMGAHEYQSSQTPPSHPVVVSTVGTHCTLSLNGTYTVYTGDTLNVTYTVDNGWQFAWSGSCPATGTTTRICTPDADSETIIGTCNTPIPILPWH